jgi:hypothetical protein
MKESAEILKVREKTICFSSSAADEPPSCHKDLNDISFCGVGTSRASYLSVRLLT